MATYKTEEVRVGTLKMLSERISEQREEIDHLHDVISMLRCQKAREAYNAPEARDICKENGQDSKPATPNRYRESKTQGSSQGVVSLSWG